MPNKDLLIQLVIKLEGYLRKLQFLKKYSKKEFLRNWQIEMQVDRIMQITIECSIDIGEEILSGLKAQIPKTYKETFLLLYQNKVINYTLMKKLQQLAEFRNELVHDYLYLGPEKIYNIFIKMPLVVKSYLQAVKGFLK